MSVTRCFLKTCMNCDKFGGGSTYIAVSVERLLQASKYRGDGTVFLPTHLRLTSRGGGGGDSKNPNRWRLRTN